MALIWLLIVILLSIVEIMTVNLTTIWFIISGLVAFLLSFVNVSYNVQFCVFAILGIVLLVTTKKWLQSKIDSKKVRTNLDRVIGMTGIVTEEISKKENGEVKVDGKRWTAVSDHKLKVGDTVKILDINGVKLIVEKEDD